jgi:hypothetical protein
LQDGEGQDTEEEVEGGDGHAHLACWKVLEKRRQSPA